MGKSKSRGKIPRIHYSKDRVKRVFYLINAYPKKEKSNIRGDGDYGLGGCPSTTIKSTPHKKCLLTIIKKLKAILTFLEYQYHNSLSETHSVALLLRSATNHGFPTMIIIAFNFVLLQQPLSEYA